MRAKLASCRMMVLGAVLLAGAPREAPPAAAFEDGTCHLSLRRPVETAARQREGRR
jgi:hypothetical protein